MKHGIRTLLLGAVATIGVLSAESVRAGAPVAIYTFTGGADGSGPWGGLVADASGNLYGTTINSGSSGNSSVVFELSPPASATEPWSETVLYSFAGGSDGSNPRASLVFDGKGNLYGTTGNGGAGALCGEPTGGCGTVFELSPPTAGQAKWVEKVLYRFSGGPDGAFPVGSIVIDGHGRLYGTASGGGKRTAGCRDGCGTVFELSPLASGLWKHTVLHTFNGLGDGLEPSAGLVFDKLGNLYSTTLSGGARLGCCGVVFELSPPSSSSGAWIDTVLHVFTGPDGAEPQNVVFDTSGNLYGVTYQGAGNRSACPPYGCGSVFELSPPSSPPGAWTIKTLHRFSGGANGGVGLSATFQGGNIYGTAAIGSANFGVIFQLTAPAPRRSLWTYAAQSFAGAEGRSPQSAPIIDPPVSGTGTFYGTTYGAVGPTPDGAIYSWTP